VHIEIRAVQGGGVLQKEVQVEVHQGLCEELRSLRLDTLINDGGQVSASERREMKEGRKREGNGRRGGSMHRLEEQSKRAFAVSFKVVQFVDASL
jgi:hypothetical protein